MLSRRSLIAASALAPVGLLAGVPTAQAAQPAIRPRADWAGSLAPRGELEDEDDVRFLLVHHTLTPNDDTAEEIPARLRSIFSFHTGTRGWADVAYNFFVDPYGTIWEGRQGSLARPVRGDATGGSQGFALLCCFVGDFTEQAPTDAAMTAMTGLLAWLARREDLDLGATVEFVSRGSSRWARGTRVTTPAVAAHRDMSTTSCPGDALYPLVASRLLPGARAAMNPTLAPAESATAESAPAESAPAEFPPAESPGPSALDGPTQAGRDDQVLGWVPWVAGGSGLALIVGGGMVFARRRGSATRRRAPSEHEHTQRQEDPSDDQDAE